MKENPINRVRWQGADSNIEVREMAQRLEHVEIQLPPDFHHALHRRFYPHAGPNAPAQIDVSDGAGIIDTVASVNGLHELGELGQLVRERHASVHLVSPVPLLILSLPPIAEA